jgi:hypothetical protein
MNRAIKGDVLAHLRGADVEVRTIGGAIIRGELVSAGPEWVQVERHSGRLAIIRTGAINSLTDERAPGLAAAGRRTAEEQADSEVGQ